MLGRMEEELSVDASSCVEATLARRIAQATPAIAHDAEAELYRLLAPRVRRYGLRHLRDGHAASDLVQQVMILVLEQLRAGALRAPEQVVSFVFGVCRLTVLNLRRGQARHERLLEQWGAVLTIADIAIAPRLDQQRVADCLERLPERERTVIVLSFYEDLQASEVAALMGLTDGNVRVIRHRSLGRLRDCVDAQRSAP